MSSIPKMRSVEDLIRNLEWGPGFAGYAELMKAIELTPEDLEPYLTWNKERYTRNWLAYDDTYELLVMGWEEGQATSVHNYQSREGWAYVVQGELTEERYYRSKDKGELSLISSGKIHPGGFTFMTDMIGMHRFVNTHEGRTISLHIYSEPVEEWTSVDPNDGSEQKVKVPYDKDHDILV